MQQQQKKIDFRGVLDFGNEQSIIPKKIEKKKIEKKKSTNDDNEKRMDMRSALDFSIPGSSKPIEKNGDIFPINKNYEMNPSPLNIDNVDDIMDID